MISAASRLQPSNGNRCKLPSMQKTSLACCLFALVFSATCSAQDSSASGTHRIAIFVPLYLDSVFNKDNSYRFEKEFPKYINSGLEFYEGAQLALDSLGAAGVHLEVQVYDTRSSTGNVREVIKSPEFEKTELILGHVTPLEMKMLADASKRKNIPFININYPNDAGITNNPDFVILNSTLKTHCEGIYKFLQKYYPTKQILYFRKKGAVEDRLNNYFLDAAKTTASVALKIKYVTLDEPVNEKQLAQEMDSTKQTICISGSMDDKFSRELCLHLATLSKSYKTTVIGMPTWDNLIDFSQPEYNGIEVIYSTPFYTNPDNALIKSIQDDFRTKFFSRPSDMVFRGYQATWHFGKLLQQQGGKTPLNIRDKQNNAWGEYDFQPVYLNRAVPTIDYYENKKLYFIKKTNGNLTAVL